METVSGINNWKLVIRRETDSITILRATTCDARAALPEELFGLPVTVLGDHALAPTAWPVEGEEVLVTCGLLGPDTEWDNRKLRDLTLPRFLNRVRDYALLNCDGLHTLRLHDSLRYWSGGALMNKGDIIINGGNIVTSNEVENAKDVNGIVARGTAGTDEAGDLIINGGNITVVGANGQGHRNGALQANGMLIINGGVINASAKRAVGMNGYLGVEINGGEINVISPWYGVTSGYS